MFSENNKGYAALAHNVNNFGSFMPQIGNLLTELMNF